MSITQLTHGEDPEPRARFRAKAGGQNTVRTLDELPVVMTVEQAASVLQIGRSLAYELTRVWRETNGREGLPVICLGHSLRVSRAALALLLGYTEAEQSKRPEMPRGGGQ